MILTETQQKDQEMVMQAFCKKLCAQHKPMVLKGCAALRLCYGLDRFSESLEFDSAVPLNLEHVIEEVFATLGKNHAHLRGPKITLLKDTKTVRQYRVEYATSIILKIESSMRVVPDDKDIVEVNGIQTYKIAALIQQQLRALQDVASARDLHDIIFLFDQYFDNFSEEQTFEILELYASQDRVLNRFSVAYDEDTQLSAEDLLNDMMKLVELVEERHLESALS